MATVVLVFFAATRHDQFKHYFLLQNESRKRRLSISSKQIAIINPFYQSLSDFRKRHIEPKQFVQSITVHCDLHTFLPGQVHFNFIKLNQAFG